LEQQAKADNRRLREVTHVLFHVGILRIKNDTCVRRVMETAFL